MTTKKTYQDELREWIKKFQHGPGYPENAVTVVLKEQRLIAQYETKDLAAVITRDDGTAISAQYLNDIEHGRRNPPGEDILRQLAAKLDLETDYLSFHTGRIPSDIMSLSQERLTINTAMELMRTSLAKDAATAHRQPQRQARASQGHRHQPRRQRARPHPAQAM